MRALVRDWIICCIWGTRIQWNALRMIEKCKTFACYVISKFQMKCVLLFILPVGPYLPRLCCWPSRVVLLPHGITKFLLGRGIYFGF